MSLTPPAPTDTRTFFRPVSSALVDLLRTLPEDAFSRPTIAGVWTVRDVLAHLVDLTFRRLSFDRDGMTPPPPDRPIASDRDFVEFINGINAQWVGVAKRFSPRVMTELFEKGSADLADWFESVPADQPGLFGVSWAGEMESAGWFDIGREFTELWHHQQQIRMAVDAPPLDDRRYLRAVIAIAVRGLPHAYRDVPAENGETLVLEVTGLSGGTWTLSRHDDHWHLLAGDAGDATARVVVSDDDAWKLFFNGLREEPAAVLTVTGERRLADPLVNARSIVI